MKKLLLMLLIVWAGVSLAQTYNDARIMTVPEYTHKGNVTFTGTIQQAITGTGYSLNLLDVQESTSGGNTRGLRVNVTGHATSQGDMQGVHAFLDFPATPTLAANAAIYPLSAWLDIANTTTFSTGQVIAGVRAIVDPNNNAMGSALAGVESALFYGQIWGSTGTMDAGLFLAPGAGTTMDSGIEFGGSGTLGVIIDVRSMQTSGFGDALLSIVRGGPQDAAQLTHWGMFAGDATTRAGVQSETGAVSVGSVYFSTAGKIYMSTSTNTWQLVTTSGAD